MTDQTVSLAKGQIILLSEGEYSDYRPCVLCIALQDVPADDLAAIVDEVRAANTRVSPRTGQLFTADDAKRKLYDELVARGILFPVEATEINLGGTLELSLHAQAMPAAYDRGY